MSSTYVRNQFDTWIRANSAEANIIDLTAMYSELEIMLADKLIGRNDPWLALQYIGSNEEAVALSANNATGKYRENGSVFVHIVARVSTTVYDDILVRTEAFRNLLRGQRINDILVESVTPPNFESGATLQFEGGYQSASVIVNYQRDLSL